MLPYMLTMLVVPNIELKLFTCTRICTCIQARPNCVIAIFGKKNVVMAFNLQNVVSTDTITKYDK